MRCPQSRDRRYRLDLSVSSAFRRWSASASFADEPVWTPDRPPEVRSTAFAARLPDLPPRPLMAADFAIIRSLVRPGRPRYPVLIHQTAALLHASFRPRLATTPLRFANPSPPSGWVEDFHLQAVDHARHTKKRRRISSIRRLSLRDLLGRKSNLFR